MADMFQFELVAPEKLIFSDAVEFVVVPGMEGDFGVLPGHALLLSTVRPGVVEIHEDNQPKHRYFVSGGFAEVTGDRCTVLSTETIPIDDIDREATQKRLESAELEWRDASSDEDRKKYEADVTVAQAMLDALK
jgi:F-type H+-transporting ATPase subunit epsilon